MLFAVCVLTMSTSVPLFSHTAASVAHQRATRGSTKPTRGTWSAPSVRRTASATARAPPSVAARPASSGPTKTRPPWLVRVSTAEGLTWVWLYSQISDDRSQTCTFDSFVTGHPRAQAAKSWQLSALKAQTQVFTFCHVLKLHLIRRILQLFYFFCFCFCLFILHPWESPQVIDLALINHRRGFPGNLPQL